MQFKHLSPSYFVGGWGVININWQSLLQEVGFICNSLVNVSIGYNLHEVKHGSAL